MTRARLSALAIATVAVVLTTISVRTADHTLIAPGASWRYNATGTNLGTTWRAVSYNHGSWAVGPSELGYGDGGEATLIPYGSSTTNRYPTYYFRHSFTVSNPSQYSSLTLRFVRDDGAVIYLNGVEITRSNMPAGTVSYTTLASTAIGDAAESAWHQVTVDPALLVSGTNVVAVEIHQSSASSSDVSFNLELVATDALPAVPSVTLQTPASGTVTNATTVEFTAAITAPAGLLSASLVTGGAPLTIARSGPDQVDDAQITSGTTAANGSAASINVDGENPHAHALVAFPGLVGGGAGQLPAGAVVESAVLEVNCTNQGLLMRVHRLTEDWVENEATWANRRTGVAWTSAGADGAGSNTQVVLGGDCTATGLRSIPITRFVQEWSDGAPNYGLVFTDGGTDGVDFDSSESGISPRLTVTYRPQPAMLDSQLISGTSATVTFTAPLPVGPPVYWNVVATDILGRSSSAPASFALTVDTSAPDAPVLVTPLSGTTTTTTWPALSVIVSDPAGGAVSATFSMRRAVDPEFTIIALPDTQHYSEAFPAIFTAQTQWIVNHKAARNIVFVTHEGDIVEHNSLVSEWEAANTSMSLLDGVVPYGMGPGNHDQPTTLYNQYFPYTRYEGIVPWYGGHYSTTNDNNYQLFEAGNQKFVIVHLQFCPPAGAVSWASGVLAQHSDRIGIMTTHAYLNESAQRSTHGCTNTQYLWDGLAVPNPNLHFMLSGHVHDESRRSDVVNGHPVFQMLADYQDRASGGEGWLRILRFVPADDRIYVQTYSPWLNRFESDANSEFSLAFPMGGSFTDIGTAATASNTTLTATPGPLAPNTAYEWRVTVTNASGKQTTGPVWSFTTGGGVPNQAPTADDLGGTVNEDQGASITLGGSDPEGQAMTYTIVNGPSHGTLTGTAPNVVYQPAANYFGSDSFTFKVNDGQADSNVATVSITILPLNDAPVANANSYSVAAGSTLTVTAPGILGNDQDVDSTTLASELVINVANGTLALNPNGSFSYAPANGFSGTDGFTYRVWDGVGVSTPASVSITVTAAPPPGPVISASFDSGQDGFTYADNVFRGATQSSYASGSRVSSGGYSGGALRVLVGGVNFFTITGMSGGWARSFTLAAPTTLVLTFRYNLNQGPDYESDEISQVLASLNGTLVSATAVDYVAQVVGNGNGGSSITTGWQQVQISLGTLPAGTHTLRLGGYNNRKNSTTEQTTILIDDVTVAAP